MRSLSLDQPLIIAGPHVIESYCVKKSAFQTGTAPREPFAMDPAALSKLTHALRARAARLGARDPEDLAQEAIRRTLESNAIEDSASIEARKYSFRILHNLFIDDMRRQQRLLFINEEIEQVDQHTPESTVNEVQQIKRRTKAASAALAGLDAQDRQFLCQALICGSAPEAQRKLGHPSGSSANACQRRNRLLARVQFALRGDGDEP